MVAHLHEFFYYTVLKSEFPLLPEPTWKRPRPKVLGQQVICIYRKSLTQRPQVQQEKTWSEFLKTQIPLWLGRWQPEDTLFLTKWGHTPAPNFRQVSPRATARFSLWDVPGSSLTSKFISLCLWQENNPSFPDKGTRIDKMPKVTGAQFTSQKINSGLKIYTQDIKEAIKSITKIRKNPQNQKTNLPI